MSRYTGPRLKVMRALGVELPGLSRKSIESRPNPPGRHGARQRRRSEIARRQSARRRHGLPALMSRR